MEGVSGDPTGDKAVLLCVYLSFCVEHKFVMKGRLRDFLVCSFVTHVADSIVFGVHFEKIFTACIVQEQQDESARFMS